MSDVTNLKAEVLLLRKENAGLRRECDTLCHRIDEQCMEVERLRRNQGKWDGDVLTLTLPRDPSGIHVRLFPGRLAPCRAYVPERRALRVTVHNHDTDCATGHTECSECHGTVNPCARFCEHCGALFKEGE